MEAENEISGRKKSNYLNSKLKILSKTQSQENDQF